jgi:hypothetical protein
MWTKTSSPPPSWRIESSQRGSADAASAPSVVVTGQAQPSIAASWKMPGRRGHAAALAVAMPAEGVHAQPEAEEVGILCDVANTVCAAQ